MWLKYCSLNPSFTHSGLTRLCSWNIVHLIHWSLTWFQYVCMCFCSWNNAHLNSIHSLGFNQCLCGWNLAHSSGFNMCLYGWNIAHFNFIHSLQLNLHVCVWNIADLNSIHSLKVNLCACGSHNYFTDRLSPYEASTCIR